MRQERLYTAVHSAKYSSKLACTKYVKEACEILILSATVSVKCCKRNWMFGDIKNSQWSHLVDNKCDKNV